MSKTERDKIKGKYRAADRKYDKEFHKNIKKMEKSKNMDFIAAYTLTKNAMNDKHPLGKLSFKEQQKIFPGYTKNPSWWNKLFNRAPKRRDDRDKLKKIDLNTDCEGMVFTDDDKPDKYYW